MKTGKKSSAPAAHDALGVANWLIEYGGLYTPLQIIKLVYLSHGWMLGLYQRPLIKQKVEAWKYGPVIPDVYHQLKEYGSSSVEDSIPGIQIVNFDDIENDLIKQVNIKYGCYSGIRLSQLTHTPNSPWDQIKKKGGINAIIPNELMEKYYRELADQVLKKHGSR